MVASAFERDKTLFNVKQVFVIFFFHFATLPSRLLDCIHLYVGKS